MSKHQDGAELLAEMEKTISYKVAACAAHLLLKPDNVVLDAGCADGFATAYFALKNPDVSVIGVDYDASYIATARERYGHIPNLKFIEADLTTLNLLGKKLDAILNLSILHEPYSYTGYRKKTVEEIITAQLRNLKDDGIIINRDFMLSDNPDDMVYLILKNTVPDDADEEGKILPETLSLPDLLRLYSNEAMRFDNNNPEGHIKGFFLEDHTTRFMTNNEINLGNDESVFYLPHQFADEFIWRMHYRKRFYQEAEEKYGYWTQDEHRKEPTKLGARVLYTMPVENPWIMENWYKPNARLLDASLAPLPLPPSNFISVYQKIEDTASITLREHRPLDIEPSYLEISTHENTATNHQFDMVRRPGGDTIDVLPYGEDETGELIVYLKTGYPRPLTNAKPRFMSPNLNGATWSGHMRELLASANDNNQSPETAAIDVLCERAAFEPLNYQVSSALKYYTAPAEVNERVSSTFVDVGLQSGITLKGKDYSHFSDNGMVEHFNAKGMIDAITVGMVPEARVELNIYHLLQQKKTIPHEWLGRKVNPLPTITTPSTSLNDAIEQTTQHHVFKEVDTDAKWLSVVRSEFHEVAFQNQSESVIGKQELEFVIPNPNITDPVSTNSVMVICLAKDEQTGAPLIAIQKISPEKSQFPAIQEREDYSGHITIPGYRLPCDVNHVQHVPAWLSTKLNVNESEVNRLGEAYFPSLGIMPNRIYPYVVTQVSDKIKQKCDFIPLKEVFRNIEKLQDLHAMLGVYRATHALDKWTEFSKPTNQKRSLGLSAAL